jgi:hypothetical protein
MEIQGLSPKELKETLRNLMLSDKNVEEIEEIVLKNKLMNVLVEVCEELVKEWEKGKIDKQMVERCFLIGFKVVASTVRKVRVTYESLLPQAIKEIEELSQVNPEKSAQEIARIRKINQEIYELADKFHDIIGRDLVNELLNEEISEDIKSDVVSYYYANQVNLKTNIQCPLCHKDDLIQKVSGVFSSSTTLLRIKLSPPAKPSWPKYDDTNLGCIGVWISLFGYPFFFAIILNNLSNLADNIWVFYIGWFILIAIGAFVGHKIGKRKVNAYKQKVEIWKRKMVIWERLYYCYRNDCVFDPVTNAVVPADRMSELLFL